MFASPVPTQTMSGLEGATAMSPMLVDGMCSKIARPGLAVVVGLPDAARRVGGVDATLSGAIGDGDIGRPPADVGRAENTTTSMRDTATPVASTCRCRTQGGGTRRQPEPGLGRPEPPGRRPARGRMSDSA